jgi:FSR family fosmidomycin resistance protein-like MFS transporter
MAAALLVAFAHFITDAYNAFLPPLLPRIMDGMGLSIALAATLAMVLSISSSVLQPLMGYLADRFGRRWFVAAGPVCSGVFLSLIGVAPSFMLLVALLILGGLGSAAFHPPSASAAARVQAGKGSGARLSLFSFGGALGFAVGPLVAVGIVARWGLETLWVAMIPGILLGGVVLWVLPTDRAERAARLPPSPRRVLDRLAGPLGVVFAISALGAFTQRVFLTFEPIIVNQAGGSEALGAGVLSIYLAAQAFGTLTGGILADRVDRRRLLLALSLVALPAHLLAVSLNPGSNGALFAAGLAGYTNMAMLPAMVVMAQEMLPEGAAVSSGIVMGLAWGLGSIGVLFVGIVADQVGAQTAATWSMPALGLAALLTLHPALRPHRRPAHG